jgi:hypothetical protein
MPRYFIVLRYIHFLSQAVASANHPSSVYSCTYAQVFYCIAVYALSTASRGIHKSPKFSVQLYLCPCILLYCSICTFYRKQRYPELTEVQCTVVHMPMYFIVLQYVHFYRNQGHQQITQVQCTVVLMPRYFVVLQCMHCLSQAEASAIHRSSVYGCTYAKVFYCIAVYSFVIAS